MNSSWWVGRAVSGVPEGPVENLTFEPSLNTPWCPHIISAQPRKKCIARKPGKKDSQFPYFPVSLPIISSLAPLSQIVKLAPKLPNLFPLEYKMLSFPQLRLRSTHVLLIRHGATKVLQRPWDIAFGSFHCSTPAFRTPTVISGFPKRAVRQARASPAVPPQR